MIMMIMNIFSIILIIRQASVNDDINDHLYNCPSLPLQGKIGDQWRIRRQKVGRGGRGVG